MSSAARFLLEFEATGDQEVVAKIKAVGAAGKETATDLESLRGIEDPFEPIATGADAAVAPIEGVGTAAEAAVTPITDMGTATDETVSILSGAGTTADEFSGTMEGIGTAADTASPALTGMGTAAEDLGGIFGGAGTEVETFSGTMDAVGGSADAAVGGLTDANTVVGDFGNAADTSAGQSEGLGSTVQGLSGSFVAIGGAIGTAVGAFFRYQDAQLRVQKSQNAVARAQEALRKTMEGIQTLLATATSNTDAIAAANVRWQAAQAEVNRLLGEGITSGQEYDAANKELQASQAALAAEFAKGGGDVKKLTDNLEKAELQTAKLATSQGQLEKTQRQANQAILDSVLSFATLAGSAVQIGQGLSKVKGGFDKVGPAVDGLTGKIGGLISKLPTLSGALGEIGPVGIAIYDAFVLAGAGVKLFEGIAAHAGGEAEKAAVKYKEAFDFAKIFQAVGPNVQVVSDILKQFGVNVDADMKKAIEGFVGVAKESDKTKNAVDKNVSTFNQLAVAGGGAGAAMEAVAVASDKSRQMTEAQSAAVENLIGPTINLNKELTAQTAVIGKITAEDLKMITAKEEENRAMIIANAGYNNATVAAIQYQQALTAMTQSLVDDTDQKNANAAATLALVNSEENAQNAIATINEEYANSVDRLADLNTVLGDTEARQKAVATVANEFTASLKEQSIELEGTLQALQSVENQEQGVANAILQTKVSLEESNQALREARAVRDDMGASTAQLQTALNEEQTALIEEEAALQASIAAANDSVIMRQRLDNAYLEGVNSIQEWNTELATSAEAEQGAIDALADLGVVFSDLPGYMAPTVENLQTFREEALGSAEAAQEMADQASEAFQTMAGDANKFIGGMADTILEGGEKIGENWQKNWEEIPQAVRDSMSTAQQEEVKAIAEMQAAAEAAVIELGFDLNTEEFAKARADFTSNLQELAANSDGIWSEMWSRAAELASTGSEAMVARISEIIKSGDPPAIMLQQLEAAAKEFGPIGDSAGTNLMNGVTQSMTAGGVTLTSRFGEEGRKMLPVAQEAGAAAGKGMGIALSEEFAAAGVHIAKVIEGIKANIASIGTGAGAAGIVIPVTVDVSQAGNAITSIVNTLSSLQPPPIKLTADVQQAGNAIASIVNTLSSLQVPPIVLTADVQQAGAAIASIVNTLATLKPPSIVITANTTQAVSSLNAASTAALTMRNNFNAASSGVKSAAAGAGAAVTSFSSKASSSFAKAGAAGTQMANKVKSASSSMKSSLSSAASSAASFASKCVSSFNKVGSSATSNASKVRNLASAISSLKSKTITITTRYVTSGRPGGLQHGGAFIADTPTTIGGTKIGEHYKPELVTVTPLTNPNNLDRTVTVNTPRTGGGGSREVVIPVTLMLDNKVLIRTVRRGLVEEVSGTM